MKLRILLVVVPAVLIAAAGMPLTTVGIWFGWLVALVVGSAIYQRYERWQERRGHRTKEKDGAALCVFLFCLILVGGIATGRHSGVGWLLSFGIGCVSMIMFIVSAALPRKAAAGAKGS